MLSVQQQSCFLPVIVDSPFKGYEMTLTSDAM